MVAQYGGTAGVLPPRDMIEVIVGEPPSSGEPDHLRAVRCADRSWLLDGALLTDEVLQILGLEQPENIEDYETLDGVVLSGMDRNNISAVPDGIAREACSAVGDRRSPLGWTDVTGVL